MDFYIRYMELCRQIGINPCSEATAQTLRVTRATISSWGKRANTPAGDVVARAATMLHTTTDFLLGLVDDPSVTTARAAHGAVPTMYDRLDEIDRARVEAYIEGLLKNEKYTPSERRV